MLFSRFINDIQVPVLSFSNIRNVDSLALVVSHSRGDRDIRGCGNVLYRREFPFKVFSSENAVVACIHNLAESTSIVDSSSVTMGREASRSFFPASWKCKATAELEGCDPGSASRKTFSSDAS